MALLLLYERPWSLYARPRRDQEVLFQLFPALLDVGLDEILGVGLEDVVDLVEQVVELGLDLLARLGGGRCLVEVLLLPGGSGSPLLLPFSHVALLASSGPQPLQELGCGLALLQQGTDVG